MKKMLFTLLLLLILMFDGVFLMEADESISPAAFRNRLAKDTILELVHEDASLATSPTTAEEFIRGQSSDSISFFDLWTSRSEQRSMLTGQIDFSRSAKALSEMLAAAQGQGDAILDARWTFLCHSLTSTQLKTLSEVEEAGVRMAVLTQECFEHLFSGVFVTVDASLLARFPHIRPRTSLTPTEIHARKSYLSALRNFQLTVRPEEDWKMDMSAYAHGNAFLNESEHDNDPREPLLSRLKLTPLFLEPEGGPDDAPQSDSLEAAKTTEVGVVEADIEKIVALERELGSLLEAIYPSRPEKEVNAQLRKRYQRRLSAIKQELLRIHESLARISVISLKALIVGGWLKKMLTRPSDLLSKICTHEDRQKVLPTYMESEPLGTSDALQMLRELESFDGYATTKRSGGCKLALLERHLQVLSADQISSIVDAIKQKHAMDKSSNTGLGVFDIHAFRNFFKTAELFGKGEQLVPLLDLLSNQELEGLVPFPSVALFEPVLSRLGHKGLAYVISKNSNHSIPFPVRPIDRLPLYHDVKSQMLQLFSNNWSQIQSPISAMENLSDEELFVVCSELLAENVTLNRLLPTQSLEHDGWREDGDGAETEKEKERPKADEDHQEVKYYRPRVGLFDAKLRIIIRLFLKLWQGGVRPPIMLDPIYLQLVFDTDQQFVEYDAFVAMYRRELENPMASPARKPNPALLPGIKRRAGRRISSSSLPSTTAMSSPIVPSLLGKLAVLSDFGRQFASNKARETKTQAIGTSPRNVTIRAMPLPVFPTEEELDTKDHTPSTPKAKYQPHLSDRDHHDSAVDLTHDSPTAFSSPPSLWQPPVRVSGGTSTSFSPPPLPRRRCLKAPALAQSTSYATHTSEVARYKHIEEIKATQPYGPQYGYWINQLLSVRAEFKAFPVFNGLPAHLVVRILSNRLE